MTKKTSLPDQSTTRDLAINFVKHAAATIEAQLAIEIKRNGFDPEKIRSGALKLSRIVTRADENPLYCMESFSIGGRAILAVKWDPRGFVIQVNNDATANAVTKNPKFGIKKSTIFQNPLKLVAKASKREIEIEARAQAYLNPSKKE